MLIKVPHHWWTFGTLCRHSSSPEFHLSNSAASSLWVISFFPQHHWRPSHPCLTIGGKTWHHPKISSHSASRAVPRRVELSCIIEGIWSWPKLQPRLRVLNCFGLTARYFPSLPCAQSKFFWNNEMTTGQILINKEICDYRYSTAIIQFQDFDIYALHLPSVFSLLCYEWCFFMMERKARSLVTTYMPHFTWRHSPHIISGIISACRY